MVQGVKASADYKLVFGNTGGRAVPCVVSHSAMLSIYSLPSFDGTFVWSISALSGSLMRSRNGIKRTIPSNLPHRIVDALGAINEPFSCQWNPHPSLVSCSNKEFVRLAEIERTLLAIGSSRFLLSVLYATYPVPIFATTRQAFSVIANLPEQVQRRISWAWKFR